MRFSEWLNLKEGNFLQLNDYVVGQINDLLRKMAAQGLTLKVMADYIGSADDSIGEIVQEYPLGTIDIGVGKTKVVYGIIKKGHAAVYDHNNQRVVVDPKNYLERIQREKRNNIKVKDLKSILTHELTHSLDPKVRKRVPFSKKYINYLQNYDGSGEPIHFYEPVEFDAIGSELASTVKMYFSRFAGEQKENLRSWMINWLRNDIREIPNFLAGYQTAITLWKKKPTLWKQFKQRLYNLVVKL